jgi:hypothetical protein
MMEGAGSYTHMLGQRRVLPHLEVVPALSSLDQREEEESSKKEKEACCWLLCVSLTPQRAEAHCTMSCPGPHMKKATSSLVQMGPAALHIST